MRAAEMGRSERERTRHDSAVFAVLALVAGVVVLAGTPKPANAATLPFVAAGGVHTCALMPDQTVWCWGLNNDGQLGNGTNANSSIPVHVRSLAHVIRLAAGQEHNCAVDSSDAVWCWGSNGLGELGNGTTSSESKVPVKAKGITAYQVSAGDQLSCAVTLAATALCWGENNFGELGNGSTTNASTPQTVSGLAGVTEVAAGSFHACALMTRGNVDCWGDNAFGELGNGTTTSSDVPVPVSGLDANVEQIAAGPNVTCALLIGGDLKCWGENNGGQVGDGTISTDVLVPTQVASLSSGVTQVSIGAVHTCAIIATPGADAVCWGDRGGGLLGDGKFNPADPFPTQVFGLMPNASGDSSVGNPVQISAGGPHACAALNSGLVECWGRGNEGELGDGTVLDRAIPTRTIGLHVGTAGLSEGVSSGETTGCALTPSLNAACWGEIPGNGSFAMQIAAVPVVGLPPGAVAQVSADMGGCALTVHGVLDCWGDNTSGEIGDGTTVARSSPVTVLSSKVESVTTGGSHTCALVAGSGAFCWGDNARGDLGDGTTQQRDSPVAVQSLTFSLSQISAGLDHTCALTKAGTVKCWGAGAAGQLGNGSTSDSSSPVSVSALSQIVAIAAGGEFTCALDGAGDVWCWGDNTFGELGNGSTASSDVPLQVSGIGPGNPALAITAGDGYACAVLLSGQGDCWGLNGVGDLGDGSTADSSVPVAVSGFSSDGTSISAGAGGGSFGAFSTCALNSTEQVECWGGNARGQLGDGTTANSDVPQLVQGL